LISHGLISHGSISLVVAASTNNIIGVAGDLPWHLSDDLKRFKALTLGKPIVMGRKTYESIGRALPGRQNIVITTQTEFAADGCDVVSSPAAALVAAAEAEEVMIIGGGEIYRLFLPLAARIYLTRVKVDLEGDTNFPALDESDWLETAREEHSADESNDYDFAILTYSRNE
jgi:dihydrofolate reductase